MNLDYETLKKNIFFKRQPVFPHFVTFRSKPSSDHFSDATGKQQVSDISLHQHHAKHSLKPGGGMQLMFLLPEGSENTNFKVGHTILILLIKG